MVTVNPVVSEDGTLLDFTFDNERPSGTITEDSDYYVANNEIHNRYEEAYDEEVYLDDNYADLQIIEAYHDLAGGRQSYENLTAWAYQNWDPSLVNRFDEAVDQQDWGTFEALLEQLKEDFTVAGYSVPTNNNNTIDEPFIIDEEAMLSEYENADDYAIDELVETITNPFWSVEQLEALAEANANDEYGNFAALLCNVASGEMTGEEALQAASEYYPEHVLYHVWSECQSALLNHFGNSNNDDDLISYE